MTKTLTTIASLVIVAVSASSAFAGGLTLEKRGAFGSDYPQLMSGMSYSASAGPVLTAALCKVSKGKYCNGGRYKFVSGHCSIGVRNGQDKSSTGIAICGVIKVAANGQSAVLTFAGQQFVLDSSKTTK